MRLVYLGSGAFGLPTLEGLVRAHEIELVVTQPDRPAGRSRALRPTPVAEFAAQIGVETITPQRIDDPDAIEAIRGRRPDALVVIAYGLKLPRALCGEIFAINLHASLLPKYRGAAPINWAMIRGESETGVSVITLAETMDAGDVLARRTTAIDPMETAGELHDRLADLGPAAVFEALQRHADGTLRPEVQDPAQVTTAPKLAKTDGTVSFDRPAVEVRSRVHGLTPWPGCTVTVNGARLKILRAQVVDQHERAGAPGAIGEDGTIVCAPGAVRLLSVQPAGGKSMTFEAYRNGHDLPPGTKVEPQ